jgi:hypothetical protein
LAERLAPGLARHRTHDPIEINLLFAWPRPPAVGALYGSLLLTLLKSVVGSYTEHHLIVIGLLFMGAVVFLPKGLMGVVRPAIERMLARETKP